MKDNILKKEWSKKMLNVLVILYKVKLMKEQLKVQVIIKNKNFIMKEIFGKKVVELGQLKMV